MQSALLETEKFMSDVVARNVGEPEFHQAVREFIGSVMPIVLDDRRYRDSSILERLVEPDRIISFRVTWEDDAGKVQTNRAWRVQFSNAIGPYKGGLRLHPGVNQSVLKFLGFEQQFKNALTGLPMGGAKGGSNFDPKGRSEREIMRFCQALMLELHRHIGEDTDIPAGDIGVGVRELGYMFGMYKRLENRFTPVLTGKGLSFGGSLIRPEATGYGCVYFVEHMLATHGESIAGKTVAISGSGNVAIYAAERIIQLGGKVLTMSDSGGFIHDGDGIDAAKLAIIKQVKLIERGRIHSAADRLGCEFRMAERPWSVPVDLALPCATQNELGLGDAENLVTNGCQLVAEGANMPCTPAAVQHFRSAGVAFAPGKAANAGGVAVSGLEQSQNSLRVNWSREEVQNRLADIMAKIHNDCAQWGRDVDGIDYVRGANTAGFIKVAEAIMAQGVL